MAASFKNADRNALSKIIGWSLSAILLIYIIMASGISLTRIPWVDEGWFVGPAVNLALKGYMGSSVLEINDKGLEWKPWSSQNMDRYTYWHPPLYFLAQAGWYRIFGISLFSMRFLSIFWGVIALISVFLLIKVFVKDDFIALIATALTGIDFSFIGTAAVGRMDMMAAALAFSGYAAYMAFREINLKAAFLLGHCFVVASGLTHANGILAFGGMIILNLYYDRKIISSKLVFIGHIPYILGFLGWGLYILQDPASFITQFGSNFKTHSSISFLNLLSREIVERYLRTYGFSLGSTIITKMKFLVLAAYLIGLIGTILTTLRHNKGIKALLYLFVWNFLIMALIMAHKAWSYLVWIVPIYCSLLANWVIWYWRNFQTKRIFLGVGFITLILLQFAICANQIFKNPYRTYYLPAIAAIEGNPESYKFILGSAELSFSLGFDGRLIDDPNLGFVTGKKPAAIIMNDWYLGWLETLKREKRSVYSYLTIMIEKNFENIFDNGVYRVYIRNKEIINK